MYIPPLLIQQIPVNDKIEFSLYVVASIFSTALIALSVSAYRKTGLNKLKYAIIAFSLFCMFLIYENFENLYSFDSPFTDIVIPLAALAILVFFFMAVVKKSVIDKKMFHDE
jgi:peptidoglycan/LPS O-acetylase OafA/YrhL